jgi:hypothetical protein
MAEVSSVVQKKLRSRVRPSAVFRILKKNGPYAFSLIQKAGKAMSKREQKALGIPSLVRKLVDRTFPSFLESLLSSGGLTIYDKIIRSPEKHRSVIEGRDLVSLADVSWELREEEYDGYVADNFLRPLVLERMAEQADGF